MYLTGIFNIPVASTRIVKVIFADISIITFYFQFTPKIFSRPKSNVLYKVSVCQWFFGSVQHIQTSREKTNGKYERFSSQDYQILKWIWDGFKTRFFQVKQRGQEFATLVK